MQSVSVKSKEGKYNPYTLSGTIVVVGIVASAHRQVHPSPRRVDITVPLSNVHTKLPPLLSEIGHTAP